MAAIDNTLRKFAAMANQRDKAFSAAAAAVPGFGRNAALAFPIGTRVLDLVTGQTGVVTNGKREHIVISSAGHSNS